MGKGGCIAVWRVCARLDAVTEGRSCGGWRCLGALEEATADKDASRDSFLTVVSDFFFALLLREGRLRDALTGPAFFVVDTICVSGIGGEEDRLVIDTSRLSSSTLMTGVAPVTSIISPSFLDLLL